MTNNCSEMFTTGFLAALINKHECIANQLLSQSLRLMVKAGQRRELDQGQRAVAIDCCGVTPMAYRRNW